MAKVFWPDRSPLGDRARVPGDGTSWLTAVGIVGDVKQKGIDQPAGTEIYFLDVQTSETLGGRPGR